ncbi:MAG: hypothetical protein OEQ47_16665, partial [Acidimicrobiia bacterium]|nr:hypothetical protein [Acidimicrobiia bacterium]
LLVLSHDGPAVVTDVSCQFASSRGRYSATVLAHFLIRETETWGPSTLLGAAVLLSILVLVGYYLATRRR